MHYGFLWRKLQWDLLSDWGITRWDPIESCKYFFERVDVNTYKIKRTKIKNFLGVNIWRNNFSALGRKTVFLQNTKYNYKISDKALCNLWFKEISGWILICVLNEYFCKLAKNQQQTFASKSLLMSSSIDNSLKLIHLVLQTIIYVSHNIIDRYAD